MFDVVFFPFLFGRHLMRLDWIKSYGLRKKGSPKIVRLMAIGGKSAVCNSELRHDEVTGFRAVSCQQPDG